MHSRSSGFWPKPSPSSRPRIRMKSSGMSSSRTAAIRSRSKSRISFLTRAQTTIRVLPCSIPQRPAGQVQEDALQVGLFQLQADQPRLLLVEGAHQPNQGTLDIGTLQLQPPAVPLGQRAVGQLLDALAQARRQVGQAEADQAAQLLE